VCLELEDETAQEPEKVWSNIIFSACFLRIHNGANYDFGRKVDQGKKLPDRFSSGEIE
jgi:hypothetical protein